jgi:hypothetical protein
LAGERNPKKDAFEMIGEVFRDIAVLVLVFAILEKLIKDGMPGWQFIAGVLLLSGICLAVGIAFEMWRDDGR